MEILKLDPKNQKIVIQKATKSIKEGKVMICPTDTVYGLVVNTKNEKATKKLFKIKQRPREKAIPIFVKDIKMAKRLAYINKEQEKFLRKFWPGKLTAVLKSKGKLPKRILGSGKKIGLRIPDYKLVNILLSKLNLPLTGTSANISGKPASGNLKEVLSQFKDKKHQPDLVIDARNLPKSKPSIVLDLTSFPPKFLRI